MKAHRKLTYAQLNEEVNRVATGLMKIGVKPGELVGICAPNSADWIIFYFGVIKTGAVAVTIANASSPDELTNLLNHAKPRILFTTPDRIPASETSQSAGDARKGHLSV